MLKQLLGISWDLMTLMLSLVVRFIFCGGVFAGIIGSLFFYVFGDTVTSGYYEQCTHWVRDGEGRMCAGDYYDVPGTDWAVAILFLLLSLASFWASINHFKTKESHLKTWCK